MTTEAQIQEFEKVIWSQVEDEIQAFRLKRTAKAKTEISKFRLKYGFSPVKTPLVPKKSEKPKPARNSKLQPFINAIEKFILENPDMEPETIEFLRRIESEPHEVVAFIEECGHKIVGADRVTRRTSGGYYDRGPSDKKGKRVICNLSVVKQHFFSHLCQKQLDRKMVLGP